MSEIVIDKVIQPDYFREEPFPITGSEDVLPYGTTPSGGIKTTTLTPEKVNVPPSFPVKLISVDTISQSLNTKERRILGQYEFGTLGAIQIGKYENGVSGDIRISPDGIVGRNVNGDTTFSIDGSTGDAVFKGTLQAGTVIAGAMDLGTPNVVLDGANGRILVNDGVTDRILIGYQSGGFA